MSDHSDRGDRSGRSDQIDEKSFEDYLEAARSWGPVRQQADEENEHTFPDLLRHLLPKAVIDRLGVSIHSGDEHPSNRWVKASAEIGSHHFYFYPLYLKLQGEKYNGMWVLEGGNFEDRYHLRAEPVSFHECELCNRILLLYDKLQAEKTRAKKQR